MSGRYTNDGRRLSSMTHARRTHPCEFCDASPRGNGGKVTHARGHVRKGEAVELEKYTPEGTRRVFVAPGNVEQMTWFTEHGYARTSEEQS